jgi:hypothetical protein
VLIYLGLSALAVFVSTLVLLVLGEPSLLVTTHLVFAVAILPLIFGAIAHFVPVLTRTGEAPRCVLMLPLLLQAAGFLLLLHFNGELGSAALDVAAAIFLLACAGFSCWLISRARRTLGKPHPGWRWYLAAVLLLLSGLALVPAMHYWPEARQLFRLLHLHLNTLGFIGLTAIGTLQVLLPTVLGGPDAEAAARLRRDLPAALGGVLATGLGAALGWPLSVLGAALLFFIASRLAWSWVRRYGLRTISGDGVSASLAAALCGFLMVLVLGLAHGVGLLNGRDAVAAFIAAFLLPLVSGALSQLLPVWRHPGRRTAVRDRMRAQLAEGGAVRAILFVSAGMVLALGHGEGLWLAAAGLSFFIFAALRAFYFSRAS